VETTPEAKRTAGAPGAGETPPPASTPALPTQAVIATVRAVHRLARERLMRLS
jgi:hypothetical protein